MDEAQLIAEFRSANLTRRMIAMNELVDRIGGAAADRLKETLKKRDAAGTEIVHSLWALQRLGSLDAESLLKFATHSQRDVRTHVMRILSEVEDFGSIRQTAGMRALQDTDALVQRVAADALGQFPEPEVYTRALLNALAKTPNEDDHLRHTIRMALRNQLKEGGAVLTYKRYKAEDAKVIADLCLAVPQPEAATFLLDHIQTSKESGAKVSEYVRHASRHSSEDRCWAPDEVYSRDVWRECGSATGVFQSDPGRKRAAGDAVDSGSARVGRRFGERVVEFRECGESVVAELSSAGTARCRRTRGFCRSETRRMETRNRCSFAACRRAASN